MLSARCKLCNKELTSNSKVQFCGCPNHMKVVDDTVGAIDLGQVVLTKHDNNIRSTFFRSFNHDIMNSHCDNNFPSRGAAGAGNSVRVDSNTNPKNGGTV